MTRKIALALAVTLAALAGCAPDYAYVPTTSATVALHGRVAADYPMPPDAPRGDVRVASYGFTDVTARRHGTKARALHLRLVLANTGATMWTFDTRDQRLDVTGVGLLAPAFASANQGSTPPLVTVPPNGERVADLFFLLPPERQRAGALPRFDALWRLDVGGRVIEDRTPFERLVVEPAQRDPWDYGPDYYWTGPYWTNPALESDSRFDSFGAGVDIGTYPNPGSGQGVPDRPPALPPRR